MTGTIENQNGDKPTVVSITPDWVMKAFGAVLAGLGTLAIAGLIALVSILFQSAKVDSKMLTELVHINAGLDDLGAAVAVGVEHQNWTNKELSALHSELSETKQQVALLEKNHEEDGGG